MRKGAIPVMAGADHVERDCCHVQELRTFAVRHLADLSVFTPAQDDGIVVCEVREMVEGLK